MGSIVPIVQIRAHVLLEIIVESYNTLILNPVNILFIFSLMIIVMVVMLNGEIHDCGDTPEIHQYDTVHFKLFPTKDYGSVDGLVGFCLKN